MMKLFRSLLIFGIAFLFTFLFCEILLRFTHTVELSCNDYSEDIGRSRRSNFTYVFFNEGYSIGHFNQFGYLGPDYPYIKPDSVIRIVLLGDSYVEGFQVYDRAHLRNILEKELSENLKITVQVLNFGRSGFDLGNMFVYDQRFVKAFSPTLTLYFLSNSDYNIQVSDPLHFGVSLVNDTLLIDDQPDEKYLKSFKKVKFLLQNFAIFNLINNCRKTMLTNQTGNIIFDKFWPDNFSHKESKSTNNKNIKPDSRIAAILQTFDSTKIIVNTQAETYPPKILELIHENNIQLINLATPLNKLNNNGINPHYWKSTNKRSHWNHQAHKSIGEYLAKELGVILEEKYTP